MNTSDLIERLRAAEGPDRELDAALEELVYAGLISKCKKVSAPDRELGYKWVHPLDGPLAPAGNYTDSIDMALMLVKQVLPNVAAHVITGRDGSSAGLIFSVFAQPRMVEHKSPAIALLIALLQAKEASDE